MTGYGDSTFGEVPYGGGDDTPSGTTLTLAGTIDPPTVVFAVSLGPAPASVALAGTIPPPTLSAALTATTGVSLAGVIAPPTAVFTLGNLQTLTLAGVLAGPTGAFTLDDPAYATVVLAGVVPQPVLSVVLDAGNGTGDAPSDGRTRDGFGVATWTPPVVPTPPSVVPGYDYVFVEAYESVTMDGTRPVFVNPQDQERRAHRTRILVSNRDVTYFRGVPTPEPSYGLIEPLLYGSGSISFPQIPGAFETPGSGALSWLYPGAPIVLQRVDRDTGAVVATDFRGILLGQNVEGPTVSFDFAGDVTGRAGIRDKAQPIFRRRQDLGFFWAADIAEAGRPFKPDGGPTTGISLYATGGVGLLDHMSDLSAKGQNADGTQWTCMPGEDEGIYQVRRKDTTTRDFTVYFNDARTVPALRRDPAEEPNRIFATGVTPDGERVKFGVYPVLGAAPAPPFPNSDGRAIHQGDTNADTDSGGGVTALVARLGATGYLALADRPGGYDDDVTDAVKDLQDDADLAQTGNVNPATWDALFDIGVTGYSLGGSHIEPAAQRPRVRRYLRSASGNIIGPNPLYDPHALVVDRTVDMGTGIKRRRMVTWAKELLAPPGNNWVGTITLTTGAVIAGNHVPGHTIDATDLMHARAIRPGMNCWAPLFDGGTLLHVSAVSVSDTTVSLTVDTQARDAMQVWEVLDRNRENRREPDRQWIRTHRSSGLTKDQVVEMEEFGGTITPTALDPGWTVIPVVAGQEGTIARLKLSLKQPAEFVAVVTGKPIRPRVLDHLIGNPLSHAGAKRWAKVTTRGTLVDDYVLLYVAGDDQAPCGYYPGTKAVKTYTPMHANPDYNVSVPKGDPAYDDNEQLPDQVPNPDYDPTDPDSKPTIDKVVNEETTPLTGDWQDDAGFGYRTFDGSCILFLAVYVLHRNTLQGGRVMDQQQDPGA